MLRSELDQHVIGDQQSRHEGDVSLAVEFYFFVQHGKNVRDAALDRQGRKR